MSSSPRCASRCAHAAVAPFVVENTSCNVSSSYGAPGVDVGDATPQVDDLVAVDVERVAGTDFVVGLEVAHERVAHGLVARLDVPADLDPHRDRVPLRPDRL